MNRPRLSTRSWIAIAIYPVVMPVMYGIVAMAVLSFTRSEEIIASLMIPGIVVMIILAIPVSWFLAPRLSWRKRRHEGVTLDKSGTREKQTRPEPAVQR